MNPLSLNPWLAKNPGPFTIGDRVRFLLGDQPIEGVIVEDRGRLGVKGERIYALRFRTDEWNEYITEMPVSELQLVAPAAKDGAGEALS
jgi:hypothetical protein